MAQLRRRKLEATAFYHHHAEFAELSFKRLHEILHTPLGDHREAGKPGRRLLFPVLPEVGAEDEACAQLARVAGIDTRQRRPQQEVNRGLAQDPLAPHCDRLPGTGRESPARGRAEKLRQRDQRLGRTQRDPAWHPAIDKTLLAGRVRGQQSHPQVVTEIFQSAGVDQRPGGMLTDTVRCSGGLHQAAETLGFLQQPNLPALPRQIVAGEQPGEPATDHGDRFFAHLDRIRCGVRTDLEKLTHCTTVKLPRWGVMQASFGSLFGSGPMHHANRAALTHRRKPE